MDTCSSILVLCPLEGASSLDTFINCLFVSGNSEIRTLCNFVTPSLICRLEADTITPTGVMMLKIPVEETVRMI